MAVSCRHICEILDCVKVCFGEKLTFWTAACPLTALKLPFTRIGLKCRLLTQSGHSRQAALRTNLIIIYGRSYAKNFVQISKEVRRVPFQRRKQQRSLGNRYLNPLRKP